MSVVSIDGEPIRRARGAKEGYRLSCSCGWTVDHVDYMAQCRKQFSDHLREIDFCTCIACGGPFDPTETVRTGSRVCVTCKAKKAKQYRDKKRDADAAGASQLARSNTIKSKYGLIPEDIELMLMFQGGKCAICRRRLDLAIPREVHIDHSHDTGAIRGLLCGPCNRGLGMFKEDCTVLASAIRYLKLPPRNQGVDRRKTRQSSRRPLPIPPEKSFR